MTDRTHQPTFVEPFGGNNVVAVLTGPRHSKPLAQDRRTCALHSDAEKDQ